MAEKAKALACTFGLCRPWWEGRDSAKASEVWTGGQRLSMVITQATN